MSETNKVVAHYVDGTLLKGSTHDFSSQRDVFHLFGRGGRLLAEVWFQELKAVYFVKDFRGNPRRADLRGFLNRRTLGGKLTKVAVRFKDGELLCGYALSYTSHRNGFFLLPADPGSNNLRIYVVRAATRTVKSGAAAQTLVRQALASAA